MLHGSHYNCSRTHPGTFPGTFCTLALTPSARLNTTTSYPNTTLITSTKAAFPVVTITKNISTLTEVTTSYRHTYTVNVTQTPYANSTTSLDIKSM